MALAYYDGQFVDKDQIKISPLDYGFARGMTLFEFTRAYGGVPFPLDDHIQRFMNGAHSMGIPLTMKPSEITEAVNRIVAANKFPHSGIKFYLTIGECGKAGTYGFSTADNFTPHMMIIEEEVKPETPEAPRGISYYKQGVALKTVPFSRQISEAKSINYAAGFIAARQLTGTEYDEILYQHPKGYVTETTVSNFFCVIDDVLCTPEHSMLQGVTRIVMMELALKLGIKTSYRDITPADLTNATEAFITGTFLEMMPVRKVDNVSFIHTTDAPVFAKIRKGFTAYINDYCKAHRA